MVEANLEQCSVRATWRTPRKEIIGEVGPMSGVANNGDGDQPRLAQESRGLRLRLMSLNQKSKLIQKKLMEK